VIETPTITDSPEQATACISLVVPRDEIQSVMGPAIREVYAVLQAQGVAPAGPWLTHHRRRPTDTFDFAVCVPVSKPVAAAGRVTPGTLPAARVARTLYRGGYDGLAGAWGELCAWIDVSGHTPRADLWERYLVGPETSDNPADWQTELNRPLASAGASSERRE
jgi:effector-binding domain-containing protein